MNRKHMLVFTFIILSLVITIAGCKFNQTGTLAFTLNTTNTLQTLVPNLDMNPASFVISGQGPNNATFEATVGNGQSHTQSSLTTGSWQITVTAYNTAQQTIGQGQANAVVTAGQTTSVTVSVYPYSGDGHIDLSANWAANVVEMPVITSHLDSPTGSSLNLNFNLINDHEATCEQSNIPSGYHTLFLILNDDLQKVAGRVEVVRILKDQTTAGDFTLKPKQAGAFEVLIDWHPEDPLDVEIINAPDSVPANGSMTVRGNVSNYDGNVVYTWYVDAECVGFGEEITINGLSEIKDDYSLDLTAYTLDGRRAGSAHYEFDVVAGNIVNGRVIDASTSNGLYNAQIELFNANSQIVALAYTDNNGQFSLGAGASGTYSLKVNKTGYLPYELNNINVNAPVVELQTIHLISETAASYGSVSGIISHSFTGAGVAGLTVNLREGANIYQGTIINTTTTNAEGEYLFEDLASGYYTAEVKGDEYITTYFTIICIGGILTPNQNAAITPVLPEGEIQIVLTWGETPTDLDSHLTGPIPDSTDRFHIYFSDMEFYYNDVLYVTLDCDDTSSYGPETITIKQKTPGTYRYTVHQWSSAGTLATSEAKVQVYAGSQLLAIYNVPTNQSGEYWIVFELDAITKTLTSINTITDDYTLLSAPNKHFRAKTK